MNLPIINLVESITKNRNQGLLQLQRTTLAADDLMSASFPDVQHAHRDVVSRSTYI
jgi:hypothetical protein